MTEQEWLASEDPVEMLQHLSLSVPGISWKKGRKLRLFAKACWGVNREWRVSEEMPAEAEAICAIKRAGNPNAASLLRCIFGNPFRLPSLVKEWLGSTVIDLAQAASVKTLGDGSLDPPPLCVLADAIEEAGCTKEILLRHLRGWDLCECQLGHIPQGRPQCEGGWAKIPTPHVRGCWAVDLILGKE